VESQKRAEALLQAPPNHWVALSEDEHRIVAVGETFEEAARNAEAAGVSNPVLVKIPEDWTPRIFRH
jgi:hypothetical protein